MTTKIPQCFICARFDREFSKYNKCTAYPDGIPNEVLTNEVIHDHSYKGDGGLLFVEDEVHNRLA